MLLVAGLIKKFPKYYTIYQLISFALCYKKVSKLFYLRNANWRDIINLILLFHVMQFLTNNTLIIID